MGLGRAHKRMQDNMTATRGNERRQAWPAGIKELGHRLHETGLILRNMGEAFALQSVSRGWQCKTGLLISNAACIMRTMYERPSCLGISHKLLKALPKVELSRLMRAVAATSPLHGSRNTIMKCWSVAIGQGGLYVPPCCQQLVKWNTGFLHSIILVFHTGMTTSCMIWAEQFVFLILQWHQD